MQNRIPAYSPFSQASTIDEEEDSRRISELKDDAWGNRVASATNTGSCYLQDDYVSSWPSDALLEKNVTDSLHPFPTIHPKAPAQIPTLYERIGGQGVVEAMVGYFYESVFADRRVAAFFKRRDPRSVANHQRHFIKFLFGGPSDYSKEDIRQAHLRMNIKERHFNALLENLFNIMHQFEIAQCLIDEVSERLDEARLLVVGCNASQSSSASNSSLRGTSIHSRDAVNPATMDAKSRKSIDFFPFDDDDGRVKPIDCRLASYCSIM